MQKVNKFLEGRENFITGVVAGLILLFMFLMALFSSRGAFGDPGDSAIVDEVAHIPAGYTYVKDNDFRLNPEHPPLAKVLAGLPLVIDGKIVGPEADWSWDDINQWDAGWNMLYETSNNPKRVLDLARLPMILLMLVLGLFIFKWAKELYGRRTALVVLVLYAFYPDVLAHGRLVTTDISAALGYVVATYYFVKMIENPTWKKIVIAGLALALAQLLKFSVILLFPIFFILIVIKALLEKRAKGFWATFWLYLKSYIVAVIVSIVVVWIVYIPLVFKTPAEVEHRLIEMNLTADPTTLAKRQFLHLLENNPILRALGHYILGIFMVIARVGGGNKTFILGQLSDKSISWYFPVAYLLKTPISILILVFSSAIRLLVKWPKEKQSRWLVAIILTPILFYWLITLRGSLNIGIRHLMPTIPFVLLLIGYFIAPILKSHRLAPKLVIVLLVLFMAGSTLANYPHFISYFNEFTPKEKRYERLVDSSLDWGQDLLRLKKYIDDNNIENIKVDYFGGSVPAYYIPESVEWHSAYGPTSGWLAVSATFYQSSKLTGPIEGIWSYSWLENYEPEVIIGGSILVFNISEEDLEQNPPVSSYPIIKIDQPVKYINRN